MKFRLISILLLFILVTCSPDDDSVERTNSSTALDGNYSVSGSYYSPPLTNRLFSMVKPAASSGSNSIDIDAADIGSLGYRLRLTVDPVTNKVIISAATAANGAPYTQVDTSLPNTSPVYIPWANSALCNNTYNPVTFTFYIRYGFVTGTGWKMAEEIMVHQ